MSLWQMEGGSVPCCRQRSWGGYGETLPPSLDVTLLRWQQAGGVWRGEKWGESEVLG